MACDEPYHYKTAEDYIASRLNIKVFQYLGTLESISGYTISLRSENPTARRMSTGSMRHKIMFPILY